LIESSDVNVLASQLGRGGVIGYPTESVFALGCDPFNELAVHRILSMKHRSIYKGFILIAADLADIAHCIEPLEPRLMARVEATWPGPVTWVFPCVADIPAWIRGKHHSLAIRISAHPVARAICQAFGGPIVSTSANLDGQLPARDAHTCAVLFQDELDVLCPGSVGELIRPTPIYDAISGEQLRAG